MDRNLRRVPVRAGNPPRPAKPAVLVKKSSVLPKKPDPPRRTVTVENQLLFVMASQARFLAEFPFLKAIADAKVSCKTCAGRRQLKPTMERVKAAIAAMGDTPRKKMKELLKAEKLVVYVSHGGHKTAVEL